MCVCVCDVVGAPFVNRDNLARTDDHKRETETEKERGEANTGEEQARGSSTHVWVPVGVSCEQSACACKTGEVHMSVSGAYKPRGGRSCGKAAQQLVALCPGMALLCAAHAVSPGICCAAAYEGGAGAGACIIIICGMGAAACATARVDI